MRCREVSGRIHAEPTERRRRARCRRRLPEPSQDWRRCTHRRLPAIHPARGAASISSLPFQPRRAPIRFPCLRPHPESRCRCRRALRRDDPAGARSASVSNYVRECILGFLPHAAASTESAATSISSVLSSPYTVFATSNSLTASSAAMSLSECVPSISVSTSHSEGRRSM